VKDNGFSQEVASTLPIYNDPFASRTIDVARLQCLGSVCKCSPYEAVIGGGKRSRKSHVLSYPLSVFLWLDYSWSKLNRRNGNSGKNTVDWVEPSFPHAPSEWLMGQVPDLSWSFAFFFESPNT